MGNNNIPDIPVVYKEKFPPNLINDINGWGFSMQEIEKNKGKLLTIDIDFGSYCGLNCPLCFRKKNVVDKIDNELQYKDLVEIILDAKKLGLKSVKFLGKGEMFENEGFLDFLEFLYTEKIIPLIFTKGHILGDDNAIKKYFGKYDIITGEQLVDKLYKLNVSIMLGFNSFNENKQNKFVGNIKGYTKMRNRALKLLVNRGFNKTNPTRLALAVNPITRDNIDEAFEIYKWGRERNLYCIVTPSMISGRAKGKAWKTVNPTEKELINLYTKIYKYNIEKGIQTIEQIKKEGISSYAGGHPCNQVSTGLYITLNGVVLSCPGNEELVEGNIWKNELKYIWDNSENKNKRAGIFNNGCIAKDGYTIPNNFYNKVLNNI